MTGIGELKAASFADDIDHPIVVFAHLQTSGKMDDGLGIDQHAVIAEVAFRASKAKEIFIGPRKYYAS